MLDDGDGLFRVLEFGDTDLELGPFLLEVAHLLAQHALEELDEFQEGLGSRVDKSTLNFLDPLGELVDHGEGVGHELADGLTDLGSRHLGLLQELRGHGEQSLLGPWMEPVNDCAVDESRELLGSVSEGVTDGREAERHVKVLADAIEEELPAVVLVIDYAFAFHCASHRVHDVIDVFNGEEVGDLTRGKQIIDEDEEALIGDLTFSEEEHEALIFLTCLDVHLLQVYLEICETVRRGNDDRHSLEHADGRTESRE